MADAIGLETLATVVCEEKYLEDGLRAVLIQSDF